MKDRILLKTNVMVCLVIVAGFLLTAALSYRANYSASLQSIEQVSALTSEGIYYQIENTLAKPVNISLTMANDSLLKDFLTQEAGRMDDDAYIETLREYLHAYQLKYGYDSVFLVSAATSRYYNFNGLDRVLERDDPENVWYFDGLLQSDAEYAMNVDNDQVVGAENAVTLFVNCKIRGADGALLGVVGVGVRIDTLQATLQSYQDQYGVNAYLVDGEGVIEISTEYTGYERVDLSDVDGLDDGTRRDILAWKEGGEALSFWYPDGGGQQRDYVVTRYLPDIHWHLVVERDTGALVASMNRQLFLTASVILAIILLILFIITHVIRSFNKQIRAMTRAHERERQTMFEKATGQMFEDIYELDISHNCPANQITEDYFARLGAPPGTPLTRCLHIIAERQIKEEFRRGYLDAFLPENVLHTYEHGAESLQYEFMIAGDGGRYYWMRITARLLRSEADGSLHMLTYRQNIDAEKRREQQIRALACTDEMTGLLNKAAAQRAIGERLDRNPGGQYAFFIFDIDRFKTANDRFGHAFGDGAIKQFAQTLRAHFRQDDLLGRIGGDEFAAFVPLAGAEGAAEKARELNQALDQDYTEEVSCWHMSASIGVALAPWDGADFETLYKRADAALYETKKRGRGGFTLYQNICKSDRGTGT